MTDSAGAVQERYEYGPYGKVTIFDSEGNKLTSSVINNSITYTGQRYDADTGLYYYKNRYYSPKLGRFMSKDPLGMVDGPNLYAYVNNDPLNWTDPMGTTILMEIFWRWLIVIDKAIRNEQINMFLSSDKTCQME
jgi:RHS repeat-associated protein